WDQALLAEPLSIAKACGAMAATATGAMTALPFPDQLNTFLSSHSLAQAMTVK
ncbi:aminoimidazole riboside kinase, partial [Salmonella enterica subsp. enterica serovar Poona]